VQIISTFSLNFVSAMMFKYKKRCRKFPQRFNYALCINNYALISPFPVISLGCGMPKI